MPINKPEPTIDLSDRVYAGVDIGKAGHVAGLTSNQLLREHKVISKMPTFVFENSRPGFEQFIAFLEKHAILGQCAILLEQTGHYHKALEQYLLERGLEVYLIATRERQKQKSDKRDAQMLANTLYSQLEKDVQPATSRGQVRRVLPASETASELASLVQHRSELVKGTTIRKNQLTAICDEIFPEFEVVVKDPNGKAALTIRSRYPIPAAVAAAPLDELCQCRAHNRPTVEQLSKLQELAATSIGTKDKGRLAGLILEQSQLIKELRLLEEHIEELDIKITKAVTEDRAGQILLSFGIIGTTQAAAILSAIGTIANFEDAAHLRSFLGWTPQQLQTGTSLDSMSLLRAGNREMRQVMYMVGWSAIRQSTEWRALYDRLVPRKCSYDERKGDYVGKNKVLGRVIGQIIGLIYLLLKQDYDLLASLPPDTEPPPPTLYDRERHKADRQKGRSRSSSQAFGNGAEVQPSIDSSEQKSYN
jgi:transposase